MIVLRKALTVALLLMWVVQAPVTAQTSGYDLTWSTIAGGGHFFSTGGGYQLGGTVGQAAAAGFTGGGYALVGGFWAEGGITGTTLLYLPLVLR